MRYTKEQRLEMLKEMWTQANQSFCKAMAEKRLDDAMREQKIMELTSQLMSCIE